MMLDCQYVIFKVVIPLDIKTLPKVSFYFDQSKCYCFKRNLIFLVVSCTHKLYVCLCQNFASIATRAAARRYKIMLSNRIIHFYDHMKQVICSLFYQAGGRNSIHSPLLQ